MKKAIILSLVFLLSFPAQYAIAQSQTSKRCEATTQQGTRCKNKAVNNTKYCQVHQSKSQVARKCKAKTKNGTRCSRQAKTAGYCAQHYKMYREGKLK